MKFTKNTKVIEIEAYAEGYYSGAEAYGVVYVPKEFYEKHKSIIDGLKLGIYELDGKHSYTECDLSITEQTIGEFAKMNSEVVDNRLIETITNEMLDEINNELEYVEIEALTKIIEDLTEKILELYKTETKSIVLKEDTVIMNVEIPKGTLIKYELGKSLNDFEIEINFEKLMKLDKLQ